METFFLRGMAATGLTSALLALAGCVGSSSGTWHPPPYPERAVRTVPQNAPPYGGVEGGVAGVPFPEVEVAPLPPLVTPPQAVPQVDVKDGEAAAPEAGGDDAGGLPRTLPKRPEGGRPAPLAPPREPPADRKVRVIAPGDERIGVVPARGE